MTAASTTRHVRRASSRCCPRRRFRKPRDRPAPQTAGRSPDESGPLALSAARVARAGRLRLRRLRADRCAHDDVFRIGTACRDLRRARRSAGCVAVVGREANALCSVRRRHLLPLLSVAAPRDGFTFEHGCADAGRHRARFSIRRRIQTECPDACAPVCALLSRTADTVVFPFCVKVACASSYGSRPGRVPKRTLPGSCPRGWLPRADTHSRVGGTSLCPVCVKRSLGGGCLSSPLSIRPVRRFCSAG